MFLNEYNNPSQEFNQINEEELDNLYDTIESEEEINGIVNEFKKERTLH